MNDIKQLWILFSYIEGNVQTDGRDNAFALTEDSLLMLKNMD